MLDPVFIFINHHPRQSLNSKPPCLFFDNHPFLFFYTIHICLKIHRITTSAKQNKRIFLTLSQTLKEAFLKISGHTSATAPLQLRCNTAPKWNISVAVMTVKHIYTSLTSRYHEIVSPTSLSNTPERCSTTFLQDKKNP